jgi:hypothetical protein
MRTPVALRPRYDSTGQRTGGVRQGETPRQPNAGDKAPYVPAGGFRQLLTALFGFGSPESGLKSKPLQPVSISTVPGAGGGGNENAGLYTYHEGDLFNPGAMNYVFEPQTELPLQTIWGFGFLRRPNTFNPIQPPQVWANPTTQMNGIGGIEAGQFALQPLLDPGEVESQQ